MICNRNDGGRRASILLIALWALFILSGFAVILGFQVRQKMVLVKRLESRGKLYSIADAAVSIAAAEAKKYAKLENCSLKNLLSKGSSSKDISIADGFCSFVRPVPEPAGADQIAAYGLIDEESKININKADMRVLMFLMQAALGVDDVEAQELAASLIDWRDADSELSVPLGSAEDSYYRNGKYPYEAKDAPFETLEEVCLVKGFNANIFEKLRNYITIYGSGRVNINTAGRVVLLSLGFSPMMVDRVISARAGKDGVAGTEDDVVFISTAEVAPAVTQTGGVSVSELAAFNDVLERFATVQSTAFEAHCVARSAGDKSSAEVFCVIDAKGHLLAYRRI
jgi:hypothetical protein